MGSHFKTIEWFKRFLNKLNQIVTKSTSVDLNYISTKIKSNIKVAKRNLANIRQPLLLALVPTEFLSYTIASGRSNNGEKSTNAIQSITRPRMSLEIEGTLGFDSDSLGVRIWA